MRAIVLVGLFGLSGLISTACTEDPLGSDPDKAPGPSTPTVEVFLRADEMVSWRDTTFSGFALAAEATFRLLADQDDFEARILGRFPLPDSLIRSGDTLPADSFTTARIRLAVDTANSTLEGTATVRIHALERSFDELTASWLEARSGEPWDEPGGDLGPVLGSIDLSEVPDSVATDSLVIELDTSVDSLLKSWSGSDGEPGIAIVAEGPGVSLRIAQILLRFEAVLEGEEDAEPFQRIAEPSTFIVDADQPLQGSGLRVGGIPASRAYLSFVVPESIQGFPLRGSAIGAARLVFHPLAPPESPFTLNQTIVAGRVDLLLDPFAFNEKTPISRTASLFAMDPDSLAVNAEVSVDVTSILAAQAALPTDSVKEVWLGLRAVPDGQSLGFWEFASVESPAELQPLLEVILTPPPNFQFSR